MEKQDMTKYCTAAALAVRTFISGSSNLNDYGQDIRQIGIDLGLRLSDLDNIKRTRGSWLGSMVDFLGTDRVGAVYQLIANGDRQPASWGARPTAPQQAALNIQRHADVYNTFKRFAGLWNGGVNPRLSWQDESGALATGSKTAYETLAVRAAANATGNCGETSLLAYLLLATLPQTGKFQAAYTAARDLTVGWYQDTLSRQTVVINNHAYDIVNNHAYVIVSKNGYADAHDDPTKYCVCDAWLGCAFPARQGGLHYATAIPSTFGPACPALPELKVGTYAYASTADALTKIQGVMQILHSAFLDELAKL